MNGRHLCVVLFFFHDTATTEIYTLSLHDALPIFIVVLTFSLLAAIGWVVTRQLTSLGNELPKYTDNIRQKIADVRGAGKGRSEEHTSELQSQSNLVCRLLLEKKKHTQRLYMPRAR